MENLIRLQKYMAECGIASRRKCEELILKGDVTVNGKLVTELGSKVNPLTDTILYCGTPIKKASQKIYILLNKPIGYITTTKDQFSRNTVLDLIDLNERLVPVGRLDMYTSGALLLSNDGDFVYHVTHPKHEIEKTYNVTLKGEISSEEINLLKSGVKITDNNKDYLTKPAKVRILRIDKDKCISRIEIKIHEGKNRQVRKMCETVGKKVLALHRSQIGNIRVHPLKLGQWRYLSENEVKSIEKNC